jgi:putative transposase
LTQPYAFEAGTQYVLQGVGYHIVKVLSNDQVLVRNLLTMYEEAHNQKDLQVNWDAGLLEFGRQGRNLREVFDCPVKTSYEFTDLDFLKNEKYGAELLQETWDKYDLIRRLIDLPRTERTDMRIEAEIKRYVAEQILLMMSGNRIALPFPKRSGKRNKEVSRVDGGKALLSRMLEQLESGELNSEQLLTSAPLQLISARQVRRWIGIQLDPTVEKLLKEAVDTVYLAEEQLSVKKVIEKLEFLINQANSTRLADESELVLPGKRKVHRYIDGLDPLEVDIARLGRRAALRKHAQHKRGLRPTRPNERWEEDDTLTDLFVIDDGDGLPIGRPWLTAVREKKCGVLPGFALSFDPPSTQTVMECLFFAIPEKRHVKELFGLRNDYVGYGVPETLAVDRGSGYLNRDMEFACAQLGIELDPMPGRSPWLKGGIERFQGMAEVDLFHAQPGTTFSDFWKKGDYDPTKHACITLDGLWYLILKWIVDIYTQEPHKGIGGLAGGVPAKLWTRALGRDFVPRLPASRNELAVLLSRVESRIIQSNGIEFENLWYQDNRLSKLRDMLNKSTPLVPVMFKYNPGDLSRIWVMYPGLNRYLEVYAVDQQYTQGLSLWKHRMIKRYAREELKKDIDRESLIQAKEELRQLVYDEFRWGKKLSGRKRNARFLDIRVNEILRSAKRVDSAEASTFSLFIDVDLPEVELQSPASKEIHSEQAMVEPSSSTPECIAQFEVSLPPQVEGVTLPVNEEMKTAGARLTQPQKLSQQQAKAKVDATQSPETPKVNTDPDEAASYGIAFDYGHRGPT